MIIKGLRLSQADEHLYQELIRLGYPEDRIQPGYRVNEHYRSDFTIMAPGISDIPIAVFEVKEYVREIETKKAVSLAKATKEAFDCEFYLYAELEHGYKSYMVVDTCLQPVALPSYEELLNAWRGKASCLEKVHVSNLTVFKDSGFSFGKKINLFIGENGSGKTQLMKLLYSISSSVLRHTKKPQENIAHSLFNINEIFKVEEEEELINRTARAKGEEMSVKVQFNNTREFSFNICNGGGISVFHATPKSVAISSVVFLPARELLSIVPSFLSFYQTYGNKWPYDKTYVDTISYLGLQPHSKQAPSVNEICKTIEEAIDGSFYYDDRKDRFMMRRKKEKEPYEIDMVAEGWRKIGELFLLLQRGAVTQGTILFWDEPEANLNPAMIKIVASVITGLANLGVQLFLTTHSLFLLKELDMRTKEKGKFKPGEVRYFNFLKPGKVEQGNTPEDLSDILLLDESLAQSDRYFQMED